MVRANQLIHTLRQVCLSPVRTAFLLTTIIPMTATALDLQPYPAASVSLRVDEQRSNHPIVSSPMKKVNSVVLADEMQRLDGHLERRVYQLPSGHESDDGYQFFIQQLKARNVEPLFSCDSFGCGDSNFWANNIFRVSTLYGMSREQHYFLGRKVRPEEVVYYTVYSVKRGNRRVYTLVDEFTVEAGAESGSDDSPMAFYIDRLPVNADQLSRNDTYREVLSALKRDGSRQLLVNIELPVTLSEGVKGADEQIVTRQRQQAMLQEQLKADGITSDRFRVLSSYSTSSSRQAGIRLLLTQ
ncbi:DUF4892 domain-containing protein [Endozoicomonas gorgoniicola]|uniref:DUF4892 domain-containing protein n=1 Tax=Endozoicomonas gorgoniicola TaxID=1234144 RepID=A0ABT3MSR8_9GAMM|nr:DUF4892 domain-containing protein [Endozoicomonas gorgoniicola]MCW7552426.1 DUF4892 domain-containing protein [Endozoicomonas gorgoniicola]